ncbi:MAG TPA: neutral/alkaline non-lysosomal ceramidase N-terminal domain-containing protein [Bacteroidales bacterium]|nr:neutral/alkaline non-lysosomal ceramidase N-terminal domain-containing protein [Bacteroidales bacterium]
MKNKILLRFFFSAVLISSFTVILLTGQPAAAPGWRAGLAKAVITPQEPMWMAGYASRDHESEGVLTDLWIKVLVLQDAKGKKAVLITSDLLGYPKKLSEQIRNQISVKYGLTRSQIILSCSHTHTGPVIDGALFDIYPLDARQREVIRKYSAEISRKIVDLTGEAIKNLAPASLYSQNGVVRFQVNRRNNTEATVNLINDMNGPNDYAVPVLKVLDNKGNMLAVAFGYSCHATVLSFYQFSGDYPGFAQLELEKLYPGTTAMFFQGAGADQNPLPRRTVPLAKQYGKELAAAVERVLSEEMKQLEPGLSTAYSEIDLKFASPPSEEELMKIEKESTGYLKSWATSQLKILKDKGSLRTSYPYPVQVWKLGSQPVFAFGGELVIQYSSDIKKIFGPDVFIMGYVNDDMAYIPSETILKEGGYEGESSMRVYGLPASWAPGIEETIINEMKKLAAKAGISEVQDVKK